MLWHVRFSVPRIWDPLARPALDRGVRGSWCPGRGPAGYCPVTGPEAATKQPAKSKAVGVARVAAASYLGWSPCPGRRRRGKVAGCRHPPATVKVPPPEWVVWLASAANEIRWLLNTKSFRVHSSAGAARLISGRGDDAGLSRPSFGSSRFDNLRQSKTLWANGCFLLS